MMTFASPIEALHQYKILLTQLQETVGQGTMAQQANGVQTFFNQDLWHLINQAELSEQSSQWDSAITEIHRHMRLLTVEVSFAQAARHGTTRQQRLAQIEQRLTQLQGFTQVLLNLLSGKPSAS